MFREIVSEIVDASQINPAEHKIAWFGNIYSPAGNTLEFTTRPLLIEMSKKYPHLFHFRHISNDGTSDFISLPHMIQQFSHVLDIGGNGYSGRLKYLLYSNRPLFLVERKFVEYFYTDLIPYQHYIPVFGNLSNLVEQTLWAKEHPVECKRIAANALSFAQANFSSAQLSKRFQNVVFDQCRHGPCLFPWPTNQRG